MPSSHAGETATSPTNSRCYLVSFMPMPLQVAFAVLFPLADVQQGPVLPPRYPILDLFNREFRNRVTGLFHELLVGFGHALFSSPFLRCLLLLSILHRGLPD